MARIVVACALLLAIGLWSKINGQSPAVSPPEEHGHADGPHAHDEATHDHGHDHDSGDSHGNAHGDDPCRCETKFERFCPFEDHHGGHGHSDLCGCCNGHGIGEHGEHGHGDEHGHEHGPGYHHSIEGYPLLHNARAEFFFIERHFHFVLADVRGADDGEVNELEFEAELLYAINDKVALIAAVPVISLDPVDGPGTSGIGDLEFGLRFLAFNGKRDGLFFGLNVTAATGDVDRDLSEGNATIEPVAAWAHDFGGGTYMYNTVTVGVPVSVDEPENSFRYDVALLHTLLETSHSRWFRYLTPSFEVNTETALNGPDSGRMVVDLTAGLTWVVREEDEIAIGWSFPIAGDRDFDDLFIVNYVLHF